MLRVFFILLAAFLTGCGIQSTIPSGDIPGGDTDVTSVEKAVYISLEDTDSGGHVVNCRLNEVLEGQPEDIPVFIEVDGSEIERLTFTSRDGTINFSRFSVSAVSEVVCVIEFADAEFESSPIYLSP